jgi:hypothetical protein
MVTNFMHFCMGYQYSAIVIDALNNAKIGQLMCVFAETMCLVSAEKGHFARTCSARLSSVY